MKPSRETVSDVPEQAILIPSDKPSEDRDGDHPENTIVIPSDDPSQDDEESENGFPVQ